MKSSTRGKRRQPCEPSSASRNKTSSLAGASGNVVLDYCSVVRGILNDNHGGPAHPAGAANARSARRCAEVAQTRCFVRKGRSGIDLLPRLKGFIDRGVADQRESFTRVRQYTRQVRQVMNLLTRRRRPATGRARNRSLRRRSKRISTSRGRRGVCALREGDGVVSPRPVRGCRHDLVSSRQPGPGAMVPLSEVA